MRRAALAPVLVCILHASTAFAADDHDASAGRIDGDMSAELGLGATFGPRAPRGTVDLRLRYMWSAGLFATYEDGALFGVTSEPRRVVAGGFELRPLFIGRWFNGLESGRPYLDLTLDSFALELGAAFLQPQGEQLGSHPALQAGIGFEIPILPRASGPLVGVHAGARWSDAVLGGSPPIGPSDRSLYLTVTLAWAQVFGAHVVDVGDTAPR